MKRTFVSAAVLAAAALVVWLARPGDGGGVGAIVPEEAPTLEPQAVPESTVPESAAPPAERGQERELAEAPQEAATVAAPSDAEPGDEVELVGTIVVEDEGGEEHAQENGWFRLISWRGSGGSGEGVEVVAGTWRATVAADVTLGVQEIELGGRRAATLGEDRIPLPADGRVELRARWFRGTTLRVLDVETRMDLEDVTVVHAEAWPRPEGSHPGEVSDVRTVVREADSPLALPAMELKGGMFHVAAPGRAWKRISLDALQGGERIVVLEPGGALEIEIVGETGDPGAKLRVRAPNRLPVAELDLGDRPRLVLEGLPIGLARVAVELGKWWDDPVVLGRGEATIEAGGRARLRLMIEPAPLAEAVPFGGEVVVPVEWELDRFLLVLKLLDPPLGGREEAVRLSSRVLAPVAERPGTWRWEHPNAQAGRYELELYPLYFSTTVEVGPGGDENVRLEAPPPGEVLVRTVDARTGAEIEVELVLWNCARPEGVRGGGLGRAERDTGTGLWRVRAPQGEVEVRARAEGYSDGKQTVRLDERPRELELRLERRFGIRVTLRDGSITVPWERGVMLACRPARGEALRPTWIAGGPVAHLPVPAPGTYLVTLPELAGYEPVPEQEVYVGEDGPAELVVELARLP